jgi:hypothetical protein
MFAEQGIARYRQKKCCCKFPLDVLAVFQMEKTSDFARRRSVM